MKFYKNTIHIEFYSTVPFQVNYDAMGNGWGESIAEFERDADTSDWSVSRTYVPVPEGEIRAACMFTEIFDYTVPCATCGDFGVTDIFEDIEGTDLGIVVDEFCSYPCYEQYKNEKKG